MTNSYRALLTAIMDATFAKLAMMEGESESNWHQRRAVEADINALIKAGQLDEIGSGLGDGIVKGVQNLMAKQGQLFPPPTVFG